MPCEVGACFDWVCFEILLQFLQIVRCTCTGEVLAISFADHWSFDTSQKALQFQLFVVPVELFLYSYWRHYCQNTLGGSTHIFLHLATLNQVYYFRVVSCFLNFLCNPSCRLRNMFCLTDFGNEIYMMQLKDWSTAKSEGLKHLTSHRTRFFILGGFSVFLHFLGNPLCRLKNTICLNRLIKIFHITCWLSFFHFF